MMRRLRSFLCSLIIAVQVLAGGIAAYSVSSVATPSVAEAGKIKSAVAGAVIANIAKKQAGKAIGKAVSKPAAKVADALKAKIGKGQATARGPPTQSTTSCWTCPDGWRLPANNGSWSGNKGNSNWLSTDKRITSITNGEPIPFVRGYPDLSKWAKERIRVPGMNGTDADMPLALKELAKLKPFKSMAEAKRWVQQNDLRLHHAPDGQHMEFVPRTLHEALAHKGGASALRNGTTGAVP